MSELSCPRELLSQGSAVGDAFGWYRDRCSAGPECRRWEGSAVWPDARLESGCLWPCPLGNGPERGVFHPGGFWGASLGRELEEGE